MAEEKTKILIVGGGKGGTALIDLFKEDEAVEIVGIADTNKEAPAIKLAEKVGIPTSESYRSLLRDDIDEIINVTGSKLVQDELLTVKPPDVEVIGGHSAKVMWNLIEKSRRAEEAVRKSGEFLRKVINSIRDTLAIIDVKTFKILDVNKAFLKEYAVNESEAVGHTCYEVTHKSPVRCNTKDHPCPADETIKTGKSSSTEHIHYATGGNKKYVEVVTFPIKNERNEVTQIVHMTRDVTDAKRHEQEIREERDRAQRYLDIAAVMILALDRSGNVSLINRKGCEILGGSAEEITGKNWFGNFIPEDSRERVKKVFEAIVKGENHEMEYYENEVLTLDGERRLIGWHNSTVKDEAGNIVGTLASGEDITDKARVERAQRLAQLGELSSDVAHEVNNPLMIISGKAQLAQMEDVKNEEVEESLKIIVEQCERAKRIVERMLRFASPRRGELKSVDINESIEYVVKLVEHQYSLKNIKIHKKYAESLPKITADEQEMQEVFFNLLRNAADAMPEGGNITIRTYKEDRKIILEFADDGNGIPEESMEKLFDPFFSMKEKGTGLGLSVCHGIVRSHGGDIDVESEVGKGTKFSVILPLDEWQK